MKKTRVIVDSGSTKVGVETTLPKGMSPVAFSEFAKKPLMVLSECLDLIRTEPNLGPMFLVFLEKALIETNADIQAVLQRVKAGEDDLEIAREYYYRDPAKKSPFEDAAEDLDW